MSVVARRDGASAEPAVDAAANRLDPDRLARGGAMSPADWAAQLDDLARLEALEAHHQEGLRLAQDAIAAKRAVIATAAVSTPVLREPERPEWLPVKLAARQLGIEPLAARRRAQRGLRSGRARKVGGRLQLHMPSKPEPGDA